MHEHDLSEHAHHHDAVVEVGHGERRTRWVVALTLAMMVAELVVGWMTGSMALLADGWHLPGVETAKNAAVLFRHQHCPWSKDAKG